ncbi:RNA methyltransferase [Aquimarina sp. U1-2]|uniref:TrmH family RNA methyltransferase n=1 Tax=Aquimarina sp. U1-2 TaxID=2823141 RepID=UPI001AECB4C8|nr:RNA methyltransferase [Aquimarina sp. U1-2]MBP2834084.1 RNA methyltransferase [Aquimarina sp. U1-2]
MVSKNQKKLIKSLYQKKYRKQHGLFVAEGKKVINELLSAGLLLHQLYTINEDVFKVTEDVMHTITLDELKKISFLTTPQTALAVFRIPEPKEIDTSGLVIALDDVRDPGNLGTIIRLCDWFGVPDLVCSTQTVDCYNPKVIQATMGSITRVNITYLDLAEFLSLQKLNTQLFGTFMQGDSLYSKIVPEQAVIVMGNEANGIRKEIEALLTDMITIPQFGTHKETESLNVATATAVVLSEFRRVSLR